MPSRIYNTTTRLFGTTGRAALLFGRQSIVAARTGPRQGTRQRPERAYPEQPPDWRGTLPEWAIFWAHLRIGLKEDEDFQFVPRLGQVMGNVKAVQVDFMELDLNIAIDIQGLFWHYGFSAAKQYSDSETRIRIESVGITYIAIDEDDALRDPVYYLREARQSRDHSRAARGVV